MRAGISRTEFYRHLGRSGLAVVRRKNARANTNRACGFLVPCGFYLGGTSGGNAIIGTSADAEPHADCIRVRRVLFWPCACGGGGPAAPPRGGRGGFGFVGG